MKISQYIVQSLQSRINQQGRDNFTMEQVRDLFVSILNNNQQDKSDETKIGSIQVKYEDCLFTKAMAIEPKMPCQSKLLVSALTKFIQTNDAFDMWYTMFSHT